MTEESKIRQGIINYYVEAETAYQNWGKDKERSGIYALHCGYAIPGQALAHHEEVKQLSRELIQFAKFNPDSLVLDAGCGTGALSFEIASQHCKDNVEVIGINIAQNQIDVANRYKLANGINCVSFSNQDYHQTVFPSNMFDAVVFCESYTHSWNKRNLVKEAWRVLSPEGKIIISDMFIEREVCTTEEYQIINDLKEGWYLPTILSLKEIDTILIETGFGDIIHQDCTPNILESSKRMRQNTEKRIREGDVKSDVLELSRKAAIAGNEALERGLIGYYFVGGSKNNADF